MAEISIKDADPLFATRDRKAIFEWAYACAKDGRLALCDPTVIDEIQEMLSELNAMNKEQS